MRKKAIINWISHTSKHYADAISIYFDLWINFTKPMYNRSPLLTTTEADIYITDKIFDTIKQIQKNKLHQVHQQSA